MSQRVMARGLHLCFLGVPAPILFSTSTSRPMSSSYKYHSPFIPSHRSFSQCCRAQDDLELESYQELFSRRMAMAGLKPHNRIALGVSGGPDSMALCFLAAKWKTVGRDIVNKNSGFIDGLLAIIVDHGLRIESKEEAELVSRRISRMGIRCEIVQCDWADGKPKRGHLQVAAREMRYQNLQKVCIGEQIGVLLIAHHADDQAELFILRLSRNSGVLGLAGMAFSSQIFTMGMHSSDGGFINQGTLLVRPLLDFWKEDMYNICRLGNQDWVEDPTNCNQSFARNRIRTSIGDLPASDFKSELQAVISTCRKTRSFVDYMCSSLLDRTVIVMNQGYVILDLKNLDPLNVPDICLSKYLTVVLQFISQRKRLVRGSAMKLLLHYIRKFPCKTSLTAAGCYLCPAPGSRGTKALVCFSVDSSMAENAEAFHTFPYEVQKNHDQTEVTEVLRNGRTFADHLVAATSEVQFLDIGSDSILYKAKELNILSESTYKNVLLLQKEEANRFRSNIESTSKSELNHNVESCRTSIAPIRPGQICYFWNRFIISWKPSKLGSGCDCGLCVVGYEIFKVRHMVGYDWIYLAELAKCSSSDESKLPPVAVGNYVKISAQKATMALKTIPLAARRSLPVIVNPQGLLVSIPTIGFKHCLCFDISVEFRPRVPLGGGYSSFI